MHAGAHWVVAADLRARSGKARQHGKGARRRLGARRARALPPSIPLAAQQQGRLNCFSRPSQRLRAPSCCAWGAGSIKVHPARHCGIARSCSHLATRLASNACACCPPRSPIVRTRACELAARIGVRSLRGELSSICVPSRARKGLQPHVGAAALGQSMALPDAACAPPLLRARLAFRAPRQEPAPARIETQRTPCA